MQKLSSYIARRYLFSAKSHAVINVISVISAIVVAFVTAAMVIVLSAFNGIDELVKDLYSTLESDISIAPKTGKFFKIDDASFQKMGALDGVDVIYPQLENQVLLRYNGMQQVAYLRGVSPELAKATGLNEAVRYGEPILQQGQQRFAILGAGLADMMEMPLPDRGMLPLDVYAIPRGKKISKNRENAFQLNAINVSGFFSINADYDTKYCIVPFAFAQKCFAEMEEVTSYEILLKRDADAEDVKELINQMPTAENWSIKRKEEKNEAIFQTAQTEKWITTAIMFFILLIAAFNIFASLTMLIIDKKGDLKTLRSLGFNNQAITQIFFLQSTFINACGLVVGLLFGLGICWLQITFGLVQLGGGVVEYYPIKVMLSDMLIISAMIAAVSLSIYPGVRYLTNRLLV